MLFLANKRSVETSIFGFEMPSRTIKIQPPAEIAHAGPATHQATHHLAVSSSGHIAFSRNIETTGLYRLEMVPETKMLRRIAPLSSAAIQDRYVAVSPDGQRLVFESDRGGSFDLWTSNADGSDAVPLTDGGGPDSSSARWSPDGRTILFQSFLSDGVHIYTIPADGTKKVRRVLSTTRGDCEPSWSADRRFIFYSSDRGIASYIYRVPVMGGPETQITSSQSYASVVSPDGQYLYYQAEESSVINLHRKRLDQAATSADELVAEDILERTFAPTEAGVYFLRAAPNKTISFIIWNPGTRRETAIATLNGQKAYGLSASRDGKTVFLSKVDHRVGQILQLQQAHPQ